MKPYFHLYVFCKVLLLTGACLIGFMSSHFLGKGGYSLVVTILGALIWFAILHPVTTFYQKKAGL